MIPADSGRELIEFAKKLIAIRKSQPLLHRDNWRDMMSVTWLNPTGGEQQIAQWMDAGATTLGVRLSRDDLQEKEGAWWELIALFNPHDGPVPFRFPGRAVGGGWELKVATSDAELRDDADGFQTVEMPPRSLMLFA